MRSGKEISKQSPRIAVFTDLHIEDVTQKQI